jgi:hypothetical protein
MKSTALVVGAGSPVLLATGSSTDFREGSSFLVTNNGAAILYVGDSGVSVSNGTPVPAAQSMSVDLATGSTLYGISASGSLDVRVAQEG